MNIVRWQPKAMTRNNPVFGIFDSEVDRLFDWALGSGGQSPAPMCPAIDVYEEPNRYVVRADLPGMSTDDIEITYQDGYLTIKGEKKVTENKENRRAFVRERFEGKFGRNLHLPEKVDVNKIEARMKDGVLELALPFTPEAQPRKIQIN